MPGTPDRPVVEVASRWTDGKRGFLPLRDVRTTLTDRATGRSVTVRSGRIGLLKPFPLWTMGCALNSGAAKWQCFHGFMRDMVGLAPGARPYEGPAALVAAALGLSSEPSALERAMTLADVRPLLDGASEGVVAKEMAIVERILARPSEHVKDSWLWYLPKRADRTAPLVPRMVEALRSLPDEQRRGSENARQLWRLLATQDEGTLQPYRKELVSWLGGERRNLHYDSVRDFLPRLRADALAERAILLARLDVERGDIPADLLPGFCRLGADAPFDTRQRLLGLWERRGRPDRDGKPARRDAGDAMLYFTLARMGLKEQAGKVEQQYYGSTFAAIWEQVGPELPEDHCPSTTHELDLWAKGRWPKA